MRVHSHYWQFFAPNRRWVFEVYVCQAGPLFGAFRHSHEATWDNARHSGISVKLFRVLFTVEKIS